MIVIDQLCYYSKLRSTNIFLKFVYCGMTLLLLLISRSVLAALAALCANSWLTVYVGGIPFKRYLRLMAAPLTFLFLGTFALIVNISATPLDAFAVSVGNYYLTSDTASLKLAGQLIMTALSSVSCLYALSLNTPMTDILTGLKRLHTPELLVELMMLIYRFIFVLLDTASAITTAQNARLGNKDYKSSLKSFGQMASMLFIRSMTRANDLFDAMEARCYDGSIHVLTEIYRVKRKEIIFVVIFEVIIFIMILIEKLF